MVTGRPVYRAFWDWVVVRKRRRIYDQQHLQPFTHATHTYGHPDLTAQSECGLLGNSRQPRAAVRPKRGAASFSSHRWNVGTNPDQAFANVGQDNWLPDRRVLGTFPRSQPRDSLITPPRFKFNAYSDPVKRWNFRKAVWKHFCLLTGESAERLPPPDITNIEKAYQELCESMLRG